VNPKVLRKKDRKVLDEIKNEPCSVCGRESDPAHIKTRGAGGNDVHDNIIPLCREHHTEQGWGWHRFIKRHPNVGALLKQKGWKLVEEFGITKLKKV
jgi:hypothetical protein